jgi:hypothetical protein
MGKRRNIRMPRTEDLFAPRVFNSETRERFFRARRRQLISELGADATCYAARIMVDRIVSLEWELRRQDARLQAGEELSGHALRARLAMETRLRLDLRDLGLLKPRNRSIAEADESLSEVVKEIAGDRGAAA